MCMTCGKGRQRAWLHRHGYDYTGRDGHNTCPEATRALVALCSLPFTRSALLALYHHKHLKHLQRAKRA